MLFQQPADAADRKPAAKAIDVQWLGGGWLLRPSKAAADCQPAFQGLAGMRANDAKPLATALAANTNGACREIKVGITRSRKFCYSKPGRVEEFEDGSVTKASVGVSRRSVQQAADFVGGEKLW
jgi:hypothetical protein